jgi:hypothetical protein
MGAAVICQQAMFVIGKESLPARLRRISGKPYLLFLLVFLFDAKSRAVRHGRHHGQADC